MRHTQASMLVMAKELDRVGRALLSLSELREGMECLKAANHLRERAPTAPKKYQPKWMISHCIKRGYNPERFIDTWNGVKQ